MHDYRKIAKRTGKVLLWILCVLALLAILGGGILLIFWNCYLPDFAKNKAQAVLRDDFGIGKADFHIRRIGLSGLDLEGLTLTDEAGRTLSVDSIRADYTPCLPMRLDITALTAAGGEIHASVTGSKLVISGLELDNLLQKLQERPKADPAKPKSTLVRLEKVTLRDLHLVLDYEGKILALPVNAELTSAQNEWKKIYADVSIALRGQPLKFKLEYDSAASAWKAGGEAKLRLETISDLLGVRLGGGGDFQFALSGSFTGGELNLLGNADAAFDFRDAVDLPVEFPKVVKLRQNVKLRYLAGEKELHAILDGQLQPTVFAFNRGTVQAELGRPAGWKFILSRSGEAFKLVSAEFKAEQSTLRAHGYTLDVPLLRLEELDGSYSLTAGGMQLINPEQKLDVQDIRLAIPLPTGSENPATLNAGTIRYDRRELGEIRSTFHTEKGEMLLSGNFVNQFLPGARVDFRGSVIPRSGAVPDMLFELNLPPWSPAEEFDPGEYLPALKGVKAAGVLSLGGAARFENGKFSTGVQILLEGGRVEWPAKKLLADDIRLNLRFTDLLKLVTPGGQSLRIGKLQAGTLDFNDIRFVFDLASAEQLNLERISAGWCGGSVMLHSIKLNPKKLDSLSVSSELFCENLQLAGIIRQLNLGNAEGDGTLFGKIPFRFSSRNGLAIDTSYLYSRPGNSNTIRIIDPEKLVGGLNEAALRQTQLDFATEALKDFSYSWTRMNFDTDKENGDLLLSLQFDGKPNRPLPFAYDEDSGQLRRDPAAKATFQGLQLNLNTRIPLRGLLKINDLLKQSTGGK